MQWSVSGADFPHTAGSADSPLIHYGNPCGVEATGKILQVLGTSSSAGKSTVTMALCRYFSNLGYRVSPFKSVNMSLNSISIEGGHEMARSQWLQAVAARTEPLTEMNPILLKPEGNGSSQVIVLGRSLGVMDFARYGRFLSEEGKKIVRGALDTLLKKYDIVVAEGAGSPAEINLYEKDIANIYVSSIYNTPAILVADIERGGVFASIYGTIKLMPRPDLVKWIIINKMRGSVDLLKPGIEKIEELTGKDVIGVVPHEEIRLPGEDSLDYAEYGNNPGNIGVIRYPLMENYSDLDPLILSGRGFSYISDPAQYDAASCRTLILPGSKNVEQDLSFIRRKGIDSIIYEHRRRGGIILGICGGYQMLGSEISDPHAIQIKSGNIKGLELLASSTVYDTEKTVRPVRYRLASDSEESWYSGYEIHYGKVLSSERNPFHTDLGPEGSVSSDGKIIGTNIHGILENRSIMELVTGSKSTFDHFSEMEKNIDLFTKAFIENVDIERIKRSLL